MPFLKKEDLVNGPINFKYHGHVGPIAKKKKAGGTWDAYTFDLEVKSTSQRVQYDIAAKSAEFGGIVDAQRGDTIQAYVKGDWVNYKLIPSTSEPNGQPHNNAQEVKAEQSLVTCWDCNKDRENCEKHKMEHKAKDIMISLAGLVQAHISAGKTNQEAIAQALQARDLLKQAVIDSISSNV